MRLRQADGMCRVTFVVLNDSVEVVATPFLVDSLSTLASSVVVPDTELLPFSGMADWHFEVLADRFQRANPRFSVPKLTCEAHKHNELHLDMHGTPALALKLVHDASAWGKAPVGTAPLTAPLHDVFVTYLVVEHISAAVSQVKTSELGPAQGRTADTLMLHNETISIKVD